MKQKQVKFDKVCLGVCHYIKYGEWYNVEHENESAVFIKDPDGTVAPYARIWVAEERTIEV